MPEGNGAARWLWLSALVIALDQLTKYLAGSLLEFGDPVPITSWLNLTLTHNPGAAFSFLSQAGGWQRWLFAGLAALISTILVVWLLRLPRGSRWVPAALSLIVGGALGNLWDRLLYGYVVDFIDVHYAGWHWPAFNVADSAIVVGAVMLVIDAFFLQRPAAQPDG